MSKIQLKLTVDQILIVKREYEEWLYEFHQKNINFDEYFTTNPLILEFDVPKPTLLEHYQAAKEIEYLYYLEHEDKQDFASYCDDRIKELSIPTQVKYTEANMLEFDVPSPWRTDIENATRDGRDILIVFENVCYISYSYNDNPEFPWHSCENDIFFKDIDITHWMEIPEIPEL